MPWWKGKCPEWTWWIRAGERLQLGLEIGRVLDPAMDTPRMGACMATVRENLGQGFGVVTSLRQAGLNLPAEAWSLLLSGEQTGRLGEAMREVGERLREGQRRRRELAGQLWYPVLILVTAGTVMLILLWWVIPRMKEVSQSMGSGQNLPWLTESIGWIYGGLTLGGIAAGLLLTGVGLLFQQMGRRSLSWSRAGDLMVRKIPMAGELYFLQREARLLRQLGTCLQAGITLPRALELAEADHPGRWTRDQLRQFRQRLAMGVGMELSIRHCPLLSRDTVQVLSVGQECGKMDHYMQQLAGELDDRVSWKLNQLIRLLEPALLLGLSVAVGLLLLAYLLPMVRLMEQLA